MKLITDGITIAQLKIMAKGSFGDLVKAVVDIEKQIMVVDGELHADEEALLLAQGSKQENLWGINIYPEIPGESGIEFDSMINLRPGIGNITRGVEDEKTRRKIVEVVKRLVGE